MVRIIQADRKLGSPSNSLRTQNMSIAIKMAMMAVKWAAQLPLQMVSALGEEAVNARLFPLVNLNRSPWGPGLRSAQPSPHDGDQFRRIRFLSGEVVR